MRACGQGARGGAGGGGNGDSNAVGNDGTDGLGGGGGSGGISAGSDHSSGGSNGGSGVVVLAYQGSEARASGGTVTIGGGLVVHTFLADGTFTAGVA